MSRTELDGWKAIAKHLRRSVRRVQDWERESALPVHRRQGSVYAYVDEIEAWKERRHRVEARPRATRWIVPSLAGLVALLGLAALVPGFGASSLFEARLAGTTLQAIDQNGEVLWSHEFPSLYHRILDPKLARPYLLLFDVDADGQKEVVFDHSPRKLAEAGGRLICFDHDGTVMWDVPHARALTVRERTFGPYFGDAFLFRVGPKDEPMILSISRHATWYPVNMALRDPRTGRLIDEYWHPGFVYDALVRDFDGDGEQELLFGGINNPGDGLGYPAMGMLELPFDKPHRTDLPPNFLSAANAKEAGYWLFPQPDVLRAMNHGAAINLILFQSSGRLRLSLGTPPNSFVHYYVDPDMGIHDMRATSDYTALHNDLVVRGLLDHLFETAELASLKKLYQFDTAPDGNSPAVWERLENRAAPADPRSIGP